jgi:predicted DNA-binding transcriptional regulator AlpA
VPITKKKKSKPQSPWLRRESLNRPLEDDASAAPEPSVGLRLLDRHEVCAIASASYPTVWDWMRKGTFPRSRIVGGKSKWLSTEIDAWMAALPVRKLKGDAS